MARVAAGTWTLGWEAVSAVATALAALTALGIWMVDRRRSRIQDASRVTLQTHSSLRFTDAELTPGEVRALAARFADAGVDVLDARRPFESLRSREDTFAVQTEILEEIGSFVVADDGAVVKRDFRGSGVEVVLTNRASLSAYDVFVTGDSDGGRGLTWDVLHPEDTVTTRGESTPAELAWVVVSNRLAVEFTMGGKRWWLAHGRPAKVLRWQFLRRLGRKSQRFRSPPRPEFREYTTTEGNTWRQFKDGGSP